MTFLEKLSIQGIRSFSPKEKNIIEFQSPLTIIVGANGTGKTTVIECLKFATTGDLPPNSRGGAFIYDPKLSKEIDVKAEVKLKFSTDKNESLTCLRTMQSTNKKIKTEQKTLECVLSKEQNGSETMITSKISDIDKLMPEYLGISHSILDNVIFCHQDESVWPVGDPTIMKKKLDDIFSSTKYNKALLGLKASKKEVNSDLKLKTQHLSFLLKEKLKKDDISKKILHQTEEIEKKNEKLKIFGEEIEKINGKLKIIQKDLKVYETLEQNYKILKTERDNYNNLVKNFSYKIVNTEDKEETVNLIKNLEEEMIGISQNKIGTEFSNVETLRNKAVELRTRNEKQQKITNSIENRLEALKEEMKGIVEELKNEFNCPEIEFEQKAKEACEKLEKTIAEKVNVLNKEKEMFIVQKEEQRNYEKLNKDKIRFIEEHKDVKIDENFNFNGNSFDEKKMKELDDLCNNLFERLNEKRKSLNSCKMNDNTYERESLKESLNRLEEEIKRIPEDLDILFKNENLNRERIRSELKELTMRNQRNQVINEQREKSNGVNFKRIKEDLLKLKEITKNNDKFDENNDKMNGNADSIDIIVENLFKSNKTGLINDNLFKLKDFYNDINSNLISDLKIFTEYLTPQNLSDFSTLEKELESLKNDILTSLSAVKVYENFIKIVDSKNHCPVCVRAVEQGMKQDLTSRLEKVTRKIPEKIESLKDKEISLEQKILSIKTGNNGIHASNLIKENIKKCIKDLHKNEILFSSEIQTLEEKLEISEKRIEALRIDLEDSKSKRIQIEKIREKLQNLPKPQNLSILENEIKNLKTEMEQRNSEYQALKRLEKEMKNREILEKRIQFEIELSEKRTVIDIEEIEERINKKEQKIEGYRNNFIKIKIDVEMKLKRIGEIKNQISTLNYTLLEEKSKILTVKEESVNFNGKIFTIENLIDENIYADIRNTVIKIKDKIINLSKKIEIEKSKLVLIEENIKLKNYQEKIKMIEEELKKFDISAHNKLKENNLLLEEKKTKMTTSESILRGELKQIVQTIKLLNNELEQYRETNKNFLVCSIEMKTLEFSLEDLEKCINGLDKAIVDFHSSKIEEVNRTLKDLWMNTYKGNDIDYIELKAESSDTRAYNYRLVMIKNGIELDMRGRSSAGQKMIASLLFRVALADSFSKGCNVIALDEPTTNLDKENVESLAKTLATIIKNRKRVQFIVITHDEDFVQLLNREGTEFFYRIQRDSKGHSHIHRHSIYNWKIRE